MQFKINIATSEENAKIQKVEFEKPKKNVEDILPEKVSVKKNELTDSSKNNEKKNITSKTKDKIKKDIPKNEAKKTDETIDKIGVTDTKIESKSEPNDEKLNKTEKKKLTKKKEKK